MSLAEEIARVSRAVVDHSPPNEACTCEWVIVPLLWATGYARHEIVSRAPDAARKIPDYTILPDTPHTWYLEAKAWERSLENDQDLIQAMNYAHSAGRRWVVLSNGREWRLYDDHIQGVEADQRLVAVAKLEDTGGIEEFLRALSKESITTEAIERFAARSRLKAILDDQLTSASSEVVKAICQTLRSRFGLRTIHAADVVDYFGRCERARGSESMPGFEPGVDRSAGVDATQEIERPAKPTPIAQPLAGSEVKSLAEWHREIKDRGYQVVSSRKPILVELPDRSREPVKTWKELAQKLVEWLLLQGKALPLPFTGTAHGKNCFLNSQPQHLGGESMNRWVRVTAGSASVCMHTCRSADDFIRTLYRLLLAVEVSPAGVMLHVSGVREE